LLRRRIFLTLLSPEEIGRLWVRARVNPKWFASTFRTELAAT
jgi:hypothetical protein